MGLPEHELPPSERSKAVRLLALNKVSGRITVGGSIGSCGENWFTSKPLPSMHAPPKPSILVDLRHPGHSCRCLRRPGTTPGSNSSCNGQDSMAHSNLCAKSSKPGSHNAELGVRCTPQVNAKALQLEPKWLRRYIIHIYMAIGI